MSQVAHLFDRAKTLNLLRQDLDRTSAQLREALDANFIDDDYGGWLCHMLQAKMEWLSRLYCDGLSEDADAALDRIGALTFPRRLP